MIAWQLRLTEGVVLGRQFAECHVDGGGGRDTYEGLFWGTVGCLCGSPPTPSVFGMGPGGFGGSLGGVRGRGAGSGTGSGGGGRIQEESEK